MTILMMMMIIIIIIIMVDTSILCVGEENEYEAR